MRALLAITLAGLAIPVFADDDLPVTRLTLYRSGVGCFERSGLVDGDSDVQLRFGTEQINDILKSMVLMDFSGGRIDAVSYNSKEPLERRLGSFAVNIADNPTLPELLNRLRGAPVRLERPSGFVEGTVLGVERRTVRGPETSSDVAFVNLVTGSGIQSIDIATVTHFRILDPQLAGELEKALVALAQNRAETTKSVDLTFRGDGARDVMVAYVHEMPVWKTSYRLVLPEQVEGEDDPTLREGGTPAIHGWAIVENTTDEDWEDIELSLVAGQPVSFRMDLYEPLFMSRPEVPVPTAGGVSPRVYADGMDRFSGAELEVAPGRATRGRSSGRSAFQNLQDEVAAPSMRTESKSLDFDYAPSSMASANEVGEVFQYTIDQPVNVERQKSAMIPIVTSPIDGRRVSIYNRADRTEHPMRGVELTNSTALQLMPGPLAVFDGDAYAGDAQIGHVAPGDTRLLAYAVDLNVACDSSDDTRSSVEKIRIANGMLLRETRARHDVTYRFRNKDEARARTIIVEHPKQGGWSLVQPTKPTEETDHLYRFEVELGGGDSGTLKVRTERLESQQIAITSYDIATLQRFQRGGVVSKEVVEAVSRASALQNRINEAERRIRDLENERASISNDQTRIRQNMAGIDRTSALYTRYMQKLDEQETSLERIQDLIESVAASREEARRELQTYLASLNID